MSGRLRAGHFADHFVMVHTPLIRSMGGDAAGALVVGAIRFRMNNFGEEIDGERWWRGSYSDLESLTGLSADQIQRIVTRLRGDYIVTAKHRLGGSWDHTLSYRLAWEDGHAPDDAGSRNRSRGIAESSSRDSAESSLLVEEVEEEAPPVSTGVRDPNSGHWR